MVAAVTPVPADMQAQVTQQHQQKVLLLHQQKVLLLLHLRTKVLPPKAVGFHLGAAVTVPHNLAIKTKTKTANNGCPLMILVV